MFKRSLWLFIGGLYLAACAGNEADKDTDEQAGETHGDAGGSTHDAGANDRDGADGSNGSTPRTDAATMTGSDSGAASNDAGLRDAGQIAGDASQATPDGGTAPSAGMYKLDCGASGIALESAGPPKNRVNYIIVGDGYSEADLGTTYMKHINEMLRVRFQPELEPYSKYRKFINICALKVASPSSGIGTTRGNSAFGGYGNDETRLGYIEDNKVRDAITKLLPKEIEADWVGVVLNSDRWWNAGGHYMVWSGAHKDAGLAAMHEGGHSYQLLADEYGGDCTFSGDEARMRVNVTKDGVNTAGKWSKWLDFNHTPGTGMQGIFEGGQYCDKGAFRPSKQSVMNMLWDSHYFNAISLENAVRLIYGMVKPIDSASPSTTTSPGELTVDVVDPAVIKLDWYVDEQLKAKDGGRALNVAALSLPAGAHMIRARAYDETTWVRGDRKELEQSVSWTIQVP